MKKGKFDHTILLLQGGGALGAYQAGAYEGLVEAGVNPDWVVGISIGGINAALIAGNPPERRVERLREFWDRVSAHAPFIPEPWMDPMRPTLNLMSAATTVNFGVPGFFEPRVPRPSLFTPEDSPDTVSFYDTEPLKRTLEELVDFDLINRPQARLSLGAVNLRTGSSVYFDNQKTRIGPDHVRASGALPPGLPPVSIGGDYYWDGGIVSNSPLWYVQDNLPQQSALVVQVDIFMAQGDPPRNLNEAMRRELDIRYSSRTRFSEDRMSELRESYGALSRLLAKLPESLKKDPDARRLNSVVCVTKEMTVAHLVNRGLSHSGYTKDYEFSRATINELWATGLSDIRRSAASIEWMQPRETEFGVRVYDLPSDVPPPIPERKPRRRRPAATPITTGTFSPPSRRGGITRHGGSNRRRRSR